MQARRRWGCLAALPAKASSQPDMEHATTPAADNLNSSRRDNAGAPGRGERILAKVVMVGSLLASAKKQPEH
jgi:hypothetical protein